MVFVRLSDGHKQSDYSSFFIDITNPPYFSSKIEDINVSVDVRTDIDLNKHVADDGGNQIYMDLTWTPEGGGEPRTIPSHIFGLESGIFNVNPPIASAGTEFIIKVWLKNEHAKQQDPCIFKVTVVGPSNLPPSIIKPPENVVCAYNAHSLTIDIGQFFKDPEGGSLKI
jgi:hypothetical protein